MTTLAIVTPGNLGADFDMGTQVATKINIVPASTSLAGKVQLADTAAVAAGTAGRVVDASQLKSAIAGVAGGLSYQSAWNAATNTPQLLSGQGTKGYLYKVSVAGVTIATTSSAAVSASNVVPVASATGVVAGQQLAATGVSGIVTVVSVAGNNVTVSSNVTIASGVALTFATYLDGAGPFAIGDLVAFDGTVWDRFSGAAASVALTDAFGNAIGHALP